MSDLHAAIMNIRFSAPSDVAWTTAEIQAAKIGHRDARHAAAELVSAALSAPAVPPGFVLVPVEPTPEMLNLLWLELGDHPCKQHALEAWQAAIAAAPSAKETQT